AERSPRPPRACIVCARSCVVLPPQHECTNLRHHTAQFLPALRRRLWYPLQHPITWGGVSAMSAYDAPDKAGTIVPFAPAPKGQHDTGTIADDSGRTIVAMLQKAADMANEDCKRAMDLAHKLSFQLRASEERLREAEAEAAHFRDRAARAEAWLVRIHNEVEQMFFPKKGRDPPGVSGHGGADLPAIPANTDSSPPFLASINQEPRSPGVRSDGSFSARQARGVVRARCARLPRLASCARRGDCRRCTLR